MAWLFDLVPPDYRAHEVLRRYPVLLARFAADHVDAGLEAARAGLAHGAGRARRPAARRGDRGGDDRLRAGGHPAGRGRPRGRGRGRGPARGAVGTAAVTPAVRSGRAARPEVRAIRAVTVGRRTSRCRSVLRRRGSRRRPRGHRRAVPLLRSLRGPADLRALPARAAARPGRGDPRPPGHQRREDRRPPGPEPGLRRADASRCTGCSTPRTSRSSSTPATRPTCTRCSPAGSRASSGCASAAGCRATRAAPRASTTGSRTATPRRRCPTPTGWPRPSPSAVTSARSWR